MVRLRADEVDRWQRNHAGLLEIDHLSSGLSEALHFHKGIYYVIYEFTLDVFGLLFLIGCVFFLWRRIRRPSSVGHKATDWYVLGSLIASRARCPTSPPTRPRPIPRREGPPRHPISPTCSSRFVRYTRKSTESRQEALRLPALPRQEERPPRYARTA